MMIQPFGTPELVAFDLARIGLALVGFALTGIYFRSRWRNATGPGETPRVLGMSLALFTLALSRALHIGQPVTWEFFAALTVFGLIGYSVFRDYQARSA